MTRKSKIRLAQEKQKGRAEEVKQQKRSPETKNLLPVIGGAAVVGGVLYVLHAPMFVVLIAAAGTALIAGAKIWERH
jgi:hypothetical protein